MNYDVKRLWIMNNDIKSIMNYDVKQLWIMNNDIKQLWIMILNNVMNYE